MMYIVFFHSMCSLGLRELQEQQRANNKQADARVRATCTCKISFQLLRNHRIPLSFTIGSSYPSLSKNPLVVKE